MLAWKFTVSILEFLSWNYPEKNTQRISPLHHKTCNCHTQSVILINLVMHIDSFIQINYPIHSSSILKKNKELIDIASLAAI